MTRPTNAYHFVTRWRVQATPDEVYAVLDDATDFPRWWPAVNLGVVEEQPGDASGVGQVVRMHTKGWLPYTLTWRSRTIEKQPGRRIALEASGDFVGRGVWTFAADGEWTEVTYDWEIRAEKPILRALSWLLKPAFSANHAWAMARGLESLNLELARRRATTPEGRAQVPAPPGPTTTATWPLGLGCAAVVLALAAAGYGVVRLFTG